MLKLAKNDPLTVSQLAKKAINKIPLYEVKGADIVNIPFLDVTLSKTRYLVFYKKNDNSWGFTGTVDNPEPNFF